jgi:hypothetical protein
MGNNWEEFLYFSKNYTLSYHSIYRIEKKDPDSGDIIQDVLQQ